MSQSPLAVGLNLVFLQGEAGGAGRYARELAPAILKVEPRTRITAFVNKHVPADLLDSSWAQEVEWVRFSVGIGSPPWHLLAQLGGIPASAVRRKLDVIHSPANIGPVHAQGVATVVTLLDLIWMHEGEKWGSRRERWTTKTLSLYCAGHADRLIAISRAARDDFVSTLGLDRDRIDVAYLGVNDEQKAHPDLLARFGLDEAPLILCVAQLRPYKNQAALIHALAELGDQPAQLALPGVPTEYEGELRQLAERLDVQSRVHFMGWVSDAELEALYGRADCFVLPSLIEGFGIPVVEAMRRGVPVACSDRGALPEVAGDAALLFDPEDQATVTTAVRRLIGDRDLAAELAKRGRERSREFTWERTAEATLACYRRAIEERKR